MSAMASQIIGVSMFAQQFVQRKQQSSASMAVMRGIHLVTGGFPLQRASKAENVSIWWCHHDSDTLDALDIL